jgi:hypothetical protein
MTFMTASARLEAAVFVWASGGAVNTACPLTLINHNWSPAPVINGSGDGLTLPAGHYMASATIFAHRSSADQNVSFQFYVDGSAEGMAGYSDIFNNNSNVDQADVEFTLTSSGTLELKITGVENSIPSLTSYCRLVVWRCLT